MEAVIVAPLLELLFGRLTSSVAGEVQNRRDFKKETEKLGNMLPVIQGVIEDAEEQQMKDKKVRGWLVKLKEVACDADDLLDEISTHLLRRQLMKVTDGDTVDSIHKLFIKLGRYPNTKELFGLRLRQIRQRTTYKVKKTTLKLATIPVHFKMSRKLKEIREDLEDLTKQMSCFQFKQCSPYKRSDTMERRETGPFVDESKVFGRDEDVEKIVEMLLSGSGPQVPVIPIVGFGGMGKTTLAQLVYNDPRVRKHFELEMWVSVNKNFNPKKIINEMLGYVTKEWDKLIDPLKGTPDGSRSILTTRSEAVAAITSAFPPYHLEALSKDDCWNLFKQRAFADGGEDEFQSLLTIGEQIMDKCKGVPLVAKILGSILRFKREESEWLHVQRSELWTIEEAEKRILAILRLSYNHLPSHLKPCFAYCSVFPKNYEINKEKLIHQWIAQDLIHTDQQDFDCSGGYLIHSQGPLEELGNEYFNNLLMMSFFQGIRKSDDEVITEFKMHDLIHDLANSVVGNEFMTLGHDNVHSYGQKSQTDGFSKIRHASVVYNPSSCLIPKALCKAKKLRTLNLLSPREDSAQVLPAVVSTFKHLRVLNLSGYGIETLHRSIGGLIHLRYLNLSYTLIETMPETICDLCNLQTLNLSSCSELRELPSGTSRLINLRHLNIDNCARLANMPPSIGKLCQLRTLPVFIVGNIKDGLRQLLRLKELRGKLKITHLENAWHHDTSDLKMWMATTNFYSLELLWGNDDEGKSASYTSSRENPLRNQRCEEDVLDSFKPKPSIRMLIIKGYSGATFPIWMNMSGLESLTQVNLINCKNCESLPTLGQLAALKILNIQGMDSVVNIGVEFSGEGDRPFSSLKELTLRDLPELKTWSSVDSAEAFICLDKLIITKCPLLITMPWFPCLQYLELQKCNQLIVRSASELNTLSTLVMDFFQDLFFLPKKLLQNNSRLMSLTVTSCPKLGSIPENLANLAALKSLKIGWCDELKTLPHGLKSLTSLENLDIIECPSLIRLPEEGMEGLCSLRSFSIENCPRLTSLPMGMKHLTALENLTIMFCSNLVHLPDNFHCLVELRSMTILSCPELASLPEGLQHLKKLQILELRSCPKLMELPNWVEHLVSLRSLAISDCPNIKSLPEGLGRLSALQHLSIRDCPDLEHHCERGKGEGWEKISHVPYIYVESSALPQGQPIASTSQNP
ncbi:PREDICTED: putative disease resistance protein RGA3 [Prunus mume]|uniref:Disease resistance protein RGA3 n=1 Tax=Prunus mume TaxID=102107 RepID=A0ABM0N3W5_PRUMU|nr:PREDICTED: putative disease resistance protein RGA3 [Prunus mume]